MDRRNESGRENDRRVSALESEATRGKPDALSVVIERTHQDDRSWGAYVALEESHEDDLKPITKDDVDKLYLVEVSWKGPKLKTPHKVDPVNKNNGYALYFLLAAPGYQGSKVLVRLRFSTEEAFKEEVTVNATRISDGHPQKEAKATVEFIP